MRLTGGWNYLHYITLFTLHLNPFSPHTVGNYFLSIYFEIIAFLPSHCGGSFPSQWSSSPPHCWAPPLLTVSLGLLHPSAWGPFRIALTQVRGSSPSSCGGSSPSYYRSSSPSQSFGSPFLGPLSPWGSSPSRSHKCGASPPLCGASPPLCGALHHLSVGPHLTVGLFPSRPLNCGASSHCGVLPHLAHSTVGLLHLSVGLSHLSVALFPISPWASSHCGALPHLAHSTGH